MDRIGVVGLGAMGSAVAQRLLESGFAVDAWNRSQPALDAIAARGGRAAASTAHALAAPVSFSLLADDAAADAVLSADSILAGGKPGRIHVNMSTVSPDTAERLADRFAEAGVAYVSGPVSGRAELAALGKLNSLVSGPDAAIDAVEPYVSSFSTRVWRLGESPRQAPTAKLAVNYLILHSLEGIAESVTLAESAGIDGEQFSEILAGTLFGGIVHSGYSRLMALRGYLPPTARMPLARKDISLVEGLSDAASIHLPALSVVRALFDEAVADSELVEMDVSAVIEVLRRRSPRVDMQGASDEN